MRTLTQEAPSAYTPAAPVGATIGTSSASVVAAPTSGKTRTKLRIQNTHASQTLYIREDGGTASTAVDGHHLMLGPGQGWDWAKDIPQAAITGIATGASTTVAVLVAEV